MDLRGCDVSGCVFDGVIHLKNAALDNLRNALLSGCSFAGAELGGVDFTGAAVGGASFVGATVASPASLAKVTGLESFPTGSTTSVVPGSIVAYDGFLVAVSARSPCHDALTPAPTRTHGWL